VVERTAEHLARSRGAAAIAINDQRSIARANAAPENMSRATRATAPTWRPAPRRPGMTPVRRQQARQVHPPPGQPLGMYPGTVRGRPARQRWGDDPAGKVIGYIKHGGEELRVEGRGCMRQWATTGKNKGLKIAPPTPAAQFRGKPSMRYQVM